MDYLDRELREAYTREPVEAQGLEESIRGEIRRQTWRRNAGRFSSAAAVLALGMLGGYWGLRRSTEPRIYSDAARDHQREVVQKSPRRWRTSDSEIDALAVRFGLRRERVALSGYRLLRAKVCLLDGKRVLHLVYGGGGSEYSLFLLADRQQVPTNEARIGAESIEGFEADRKTGLVVSDGSAAECRHFAKTVVAALL